jgi:hypothetical protein
MCSYNRWTSWQESIIREMIRNGDGYWEIASKLHRSIEAIKTKVSRMGISRHPEVGVRLAEARAKARAMRDEDFLQHSGESTDWTGDWAEA